MCSTGTTAARIPELCNGCYCGTRQHTHVLTSVLLLITVKLSCIVASSLISLINKYFKFDLLINGNLFMGQV